MTFHMWDDFWSAHDDVINWSHFLDYQRYSMRGNIRIGHHDNRRWGQIQIQIQVYNAKRQWIGRHTMRCGQHVQNNYIWALLWYHTFACKQWNQNFATHPISFGIVMLIILLNLCHSINGNTDFKIRFVFEMCNIRHLAIGARRIYRFGYIFKSILLFINLTSFNYAFVFLGTNTLNFVKNYHC